MLHTYDIGSFWTRQHHMAFTDSALWRTLRHLPELGRRGPWVAGGAVRRAVMGEPLGKDVDVFFRDANQFDAYRDRLRSTDFRERPDEETSRRVKLSFGAHPDVDLVRGSYFEDPADLLSNFDFTCCCFATDGLDLWVNEHALLDASRRILRVNNREKMESSLLHMERYLREGFTAEPACWNEFLRHGAKDRADAVQGYSGR